MTSIPAIKVNFIGAESAETLATSKGLKKERMEFLGFSDNKRHFAVAIESKPIFQEKSTDKPPTLNFLERRRFVLLKVSEPDGKTGFVKVNARSLQKRLGIDVEKEVKKHGSRDLTQVVSAKLHNIITEHANAHDIEANVFLGNEVLKNEPKKALQYFKAAMACDKGRDLRRLHDKAQAELRQLGRQLGDQCAAENDEATALNYYKEAADAGDEEALNKVIDYYVQQGEGLDQKEALKWYQKAPNNGAALYRLGEIAKKDDAKKAFDFYKKAANLRHPQAMFTLAQCYDYARGTRQNKEKAFFWVKKAAEANIPKAIDKLGYHYLEGVGTAKNITEGIKWLQKAIESFNSPWALFLLAEHYEETGGKPTSEIVAMYEKAANQGHLNAMKKLGLCYKSGYGVAVDPAKEFYWLQKGAQQEMFNTKYLLADCYAEGRGTPVDMGRALNLLEESAEKTIQWPKLSMGNIYTDPTYGEKAMKLLQDAAEKGNKWAASRLGNIYSNPPYSDFSKAQPFYEVAAKAGMVDAMMLLGSHHFNSGNFEEAKEWYKMAAKHEDVMGTNMVGMCYWKMNEQPRAFKWFEKAALKGSHFAMYNLSNFYRSILRTPNPEKADYWLKQAAEKGNQTAIDDLKNSASPAPQPKSNENASWKSRWFDW